MGFQLSGGAPGFGDALVFVLAVSAAIPVVIWFVMIVRQARRDVVEDSDTDLEA